MTRHCWAATLSWNRTISFSISSCSGLYWVQSVSRLISPHGSAMPKGLYFTAVVYLFIYFFLTPNIWGHWMDFNQTWTHIHLWLLFEKFGPNSPGIYPHVLGAKNRFFGTDFELWMNMSLQRNTISTIGKKLVNLQGLPYMPPPNLVKFGPETAENGWRVFAYP